MPHTAPVTVDVLPAYWTVFGSTIAAAAPEGAWQPIMARSDVSVVDHDEHDAAIVAAEAAAAAAAAPIAATEVPTAAEPVSPSAASVTTPLVASSEVVVASGLQEAAQV